MKHKKIMIILITAVFLVSIAGVCAADVNDTIVTSEDNLEIDKTTDDAIGVGEDTDLASSEENEILTGGEQTFTQLNATINGNTDKDIYLNGDYKYSSGDDSFKGGIVINRDVNIYGNGATIDGNMETRIFQINGGNAVFYNITFRNGNAGDDYDENGGAINGNCKAINCIFQENHAFRGGALHGGSARDCSFFSNRAEDSGGAMHYGSAVNCNFIDNMAEYDGGAMHYGSAVNCNFIDNMAEYDGGAMFGCYKMNCTGQDDDFYEVRELVLRWDANDFTASYRLGDTLPVQLKNQERGLVDCIDYDVVIYKDGREVKTYHCLSNDGPVIDLLPGVYTAGLVVTYPGIDKPEPKSITLTVTDGTTFWDLNRDINDNANATITLDNDYTFNSTTDSAFTEGIVINRPLTVNGNGHVIDAQGNARVFDVEAGDVAIENLSIKNAKSKNGGAIYFNCLGTVSNCNFTDNEATGGITFGGAIYFAEQGTVSNCNFAGNKVWYGGAIHFEGQGTVSNCNFTGNQATGYFGCGAAIVFNKQGTVSNCSFTRNTAHDGGGAIRMLSGTVSNCSFTENTANIGGAIKMLSGTVSNCSFTENTANIGGGAISMDSGTVSNCNFSDNQATQGDAGALFFSVSGNVTNCNFIGNEATGNYAFGGAVRFGSSNGNVSNCNFSKNTASEKGGAVSFGVLGTVSNCNFIENTAWNQGGAVYFSEHGNVGNSNFTGNIANAGSAIYFNTDSSTKTISDSIFLNNRASADAFGATQNESNLEITFMGRNNLINAIYSKGDVAFANVTYWGANNITNTDDYYPSRSNGEAGQNITVTGFVNGNIFDAVKTTNAEGKIVLEGVTDYWIAVRHDSDSYYTQAEAIMSNLYANVTSAVSNNRTVNITAKSNVFNETMPGKLLFILPNGAEIDAIYAAGGIWWAVHTFDDYADYQVNAAYVGLSNVAISNANISITRANSTVELSDVVLNYGETKNVTVTAEGATGITAKINDTNVTVVNNFTIPISGLAAGNYTLTVTTIADEDHNPVTKTVKITVNKAHTEILIVNETLDLKVGDETIVATLVPAGAGNVTFTSSNVSVVDFDDEGNVIAQGKGQAIITVSFAGNNNYAAAENRTVTVTVSLNNANVTVGNDTCDLKVGEAYAINATKHPDTILLDITYTSSNSSVATVDEKGIVTAVGVGSAVITVEVGDDEIYAKNSTTVKVTVSKVPTEIAADPIAATYNANKDLVITLKDSNGNPIGGLNITVDFNGTKNYTTDTNGQVKISTKGIAANIYDVLISFNGTDKYLNSSNTTTVSIYKESSKVDTKPLTTDYNVHKYLVVGLKDKEGNPIRNADAFIEIHGVTYKCRSDDVGNAKLIIRLNPGTYTAKITFDNVNYTGFTQYVTVIVKKLTPKLTAKKKTFKKSKKVKKYTVTLKANNKVLAKVKLTLKVKGKTYKAKTNSKGKVVFKIKNLKKKGTFKAKVKFAGNTYYNAVTKTVKIKVK